MNAEQLMKRIIESGGDELGIKDRFSGDSELYQLCFIEFIEEHTFIMLEKAIAERDYTQALASAHALKGLAGNLGVTAFYDAICVLVESLRLNNYNNVEAGYAEVKRQTDILKGLLADEQAVTPAPAKSQPAKAKQTKTPKAPAARPRKDRFISAVIVATILIIAAVWGLFGQLIASYKSNVTTESASHLLEINHQLQLYTESRIENDWMILCSLGDNIIHSNYTDDDAAVFNLLQRKRDIWKATDIVIYTESGYNMCADGTVEANDVATNLIAKAQSLGEYMTIVDSELTYLIPLQAELKFGGSRVVALSMTRDMEHFLDDMGFYSFDGHAYMYLTDPKGVVISQLTNQNTSFTYNVNSLFNSKNMTAISDTAQNANIISVEVPAVYSVSGATGNDYVISSPLSTRTEMLRLFYFAPETVVNQTMNAFTKSVTFISILVIAIVTVCALLAFIFIYRTRKKQFDTALMARDRLFDLLVKNTHTAFGLFAPNQEPDYISGNVAEVIGEPRLFIVKTESGFSMSNGTETETAAVRQINEKLSCWDGISQFRSGFIRNEHALPPRWFELQLFPIGADASNLEEYAGIAQDVTLLHERETTTRDALVMAEQANEAKTRFLSNMSHDIRTPMNAIINMADFAIEDIHNPEQLSDQLKTIRESANYLLLLINDILDMSRIESGKAVIQNHPFDLNETLESLKNMVQPLCTDKNLQFITDFDKLSKTGILGDQTKVTQILMNLLSNAVKFTDPQGAVRFSAQEVPSIRENYANIRFTVEDTGIGISQEFLQHIFDPFTRADEKRVSGIQGTGLGLSICHSYVEAMGGIIKCESEEDVGTIFTVDLFFEKTAVLAQQKAEATAWDANSFAGKRCLLCEDNSTNQRIARTILERLGFSVDIAADGREGLNKFLQSSFGYYDIIYMDIQMPYMDGYEVTAAIRKSAHPQGKTIPIIAVTANVFIEDIEKARIAGMDGHIGKPLNTTALANETNQVFNNKQN